MQAPCQYHHAIMNDQSLPSMVCLAAKQDRHPLLPSCPAGFMRMRMCLAIMNDKGMAGVLLPHHNLGVNARCAVV